MNAESLFTLRTTGVLLITSVVAPMIGLIIIGRGDFSGFQASIRGIDGVGESADVLRRTFPLAPLNVVLTLAGYGILTLLLIGDGDIGISIFAFILLLISQVFLIFQGTFHSSVTVWASKQLSSEGSVPDLFQSLWQWMYSSVQQVYVNIGLLSIAAYGISILSTTFLPRWIGWGSIGWGLAWFVLFLFLQDNLPLVLFVPTLIIGFVAF